MQGSDDEKIVEGSAEEIGDGVEDNKMTSSPTEENEALEALELEEAAAEPPTLEEQLASALTEAEDYKDRWLRSQAEFANARKRMEKQRVDLFATATSDVMKTLLPIVDDFSRALENVPESITESSWLEGIQLVQRKLDSILETYNVSTIEAVGQPFDPNIHEAISQEATDEYDSGVVCKELQTGYKIGDRVIRPSLVIVAE